nr:unnamed protein product [Callosobruchus chinensis]
MGDFNVTNYVLHDYSDSRCCSLGNFIDFTNLLQCNNILNSTNRLLDLVLATDDLKCEVTREFSPIISNEDLHHPSLNIQLNMQSPETNSLPCNLNYHTYNFKKAFFLGLYNALTYIDWSFLYEFNDINEMCSAFYHKIYQILDLYVPKFKHYKRNYPSWYTPAIIQNIKTKNYYHRKFQSTKNHFYYTEFCRLRRLIKVQVCESYQSFLRCTEGNIIDDPKRFWAYIHQKKNFSRIPGKVHYGNTMYDTPEEVVKGFADYFHSVYTPQQNNNKAGPVDHNSQLIHISHFSEEIIIQHLKKLPNKFTSGQDYLPSFFLRDCAHLFSKPLYIIFNSILKYSVFPDVWKIARVCPIFKAGDKTDMSNYRGISILNNFAKVFEMMVYSMVYYDIKQSISPSQHGFMRGRSTTSNLVTITQYISDALDSRQQVDVIYTDFSKAFDKIDHNLLICSLEKFGFSVPLITLFKSYLHNRSQYVSCNGHLSETYVASSGVPQGSNLGPLLFLLFINELTDSLDCHKLLFADDLKIYATISDEDSCRNLQTQLNKVAEWCKHNLLQLNIAKCKVCSYSRKSQPLIFSYKIESMSIVRCNEIKDLGVTFDSRLGFVEHMTNIASEATRILGFLIRNCRSFTNIAALRTLYCALVRSKLEYASIVWSPAYCTHVEMLESIQRKFLKYLSFKVDGIYPERGISQRSLRERFNFDSLELRRGNSALVFLYKLLHNSIDCIDLLDQLNLLIPRLNARRSVTFYCKRCRTSVMQHSPINTMCANFNLISNDCDIFSDSAPTILCEFRRHSGA